jgi:hypothetical protein
VQDEGQREFQKKDNPCLTVRPLTPTQVGQYSDAVQYGLRMGLPTMAGDEPAIARVLSDIITGQIQCWGLTIDANLVGMMTTKLDTEQYTNKRTLLVFSLYASTGVGLDAWRPVGEFLEGYARKCGCCKVLALSGVTDAVGLAESLGWDVSQRVLVKEV